MSSVPLVLALAAPEATLELAGGKGASLARMAAAGLPVPPGFHITTAAYRRFVAENDLLGAISAAAAGASADDLASLERASASITACFADAAISDEIVAAVRAAYASLGAGDPPVAVRSSATAEDLPGMSFAGQQETYLNMRGEAMLVPAIKRCWASLWTARAIGYRARHGIRPEDVSLAVVVQELVPADAAGILFTANPLTGARDQMIINAAWGLGEAIVGGLVTPDQLVVAKATGAITASEIADKALMTVRTPNGTWEEPVPPDRRTAAVLDPAQAAELARLGTRIEDLYGQPMDIEWAIQDGRIFILQARPITALPEPAAESRAALTPEWPLPKPQGRYIRASAIELMPDPLSPLFATLGLPAWNQAMQGLVERLGGADFMSDYVLLTINGYAYYDASFTAAQNAGFLRMMPRLLRVIGDLLRTTQERWEREARPAYEAIVREWSARDLRATPAAQLLDGARAIVDEAARHYLTLQSGILPAAYMSEMLFTMFYDRLIRRAGDPPALTFLLGYDSAPIRAEKSLYDLATWARAQPGLAERLTHTPGDRLAPAQGDGAQGAGDEVWQEFQRRFAEHLDRFGHAIYDLDFAKAVPADDPAPLLETLKFFLSGQAPDPHQRQAAAAAAREQAVRAMMARLRGLRLALFWGLVRLAQRFAPLREDGLADIGLGWPVLRRMLREVGRRLALEGAIDEQDDLFWLQLDELRTAVAALDAGEPAARYQASVAERRARWAAESSLTPPSALPTKGRVTFMGVDYRRWLPANTEQAEGDTIRGIGASPGHVAGPARVIHGPDEFDRMRHGDILVAKITTPAWTPLFALASGVVTDVGGPLSHGSIVAREYHIPAVLGTGVATARIRSDQRVMVDGDAGTVRIDGM